MEFWTKGEAEKYVYKFRALNAPQKKTLLDTLNLRFPPAVYRHHHALQQKAIRNAEKAKTVLSGAKQRYPHLFRISDVDASLKDLAGYAIVLTAGGDGERLRLSLQASGVGDASLKDFTKATFQLPGFPEGYGSLQANCVVIADLCRQGNLQLPVLVTTGPASSVSARVIPEVLRAYKNFNLPYLRTMAQDERLHLTLDGKIVCAIDGDAARPVTNPDETGGPFVALTKKGVTGSSSCLEWFSSLGCTKIIALQATALYDPKVILAMAAAGKRHDCIGVGVLRRQFDKEDPFGTFVLVERSNRESLIIVEQGIRNDATRLVKDRTAQYHLPYNTGLYVFDAELLGAEGLPDYATPPKEVLPSLPRSPKIGYAATDIMPLAKNGAILAIEPDSYESIKNADDLFRLSLLAKRCGIIDLCK